MLPKGFRRIRHNGLLANGNRAANITKARQLLDVLPRPGKTEPGQTDAQAETRTHPCLWPSCGGLMIIIESFEAGEEPRHHPRAPPPAILRSETARRRNRSPSTATPLFNIAGSTPAMVAHASDQRSGPKMRRYTLMASPFPSVSSLTHYDRQEHAPRPDPVPALTNRSGLSQIPIENAVLPPAPQPAISCLGASPTPDTPAVHLTRPARRPRNLHRSCLQVTRHPWPKTAVGDLPQFCDAAHALPTLVRTVAVVGKITDRRTIWTM